MIGRPKAITSVVLQKLEWAFKLGASDKEACNEAKIAPQTLYNYQAENPDFLEQKEAWKSTPVFRARKTVVEHLARDPHFALKYLERRLPDEFGKLEGVTTNSTQAHIERVRAKYQSIHETVENERKLYSV